MLRTLLLCGDYWHATAPYHPMLKRVLGDDVDGLRLRAHPDSFDSSCLRDFDLLVLCKESVVPGTHGTPQQRNWLFREQELDILRWVQGGGMLFVWHSGAAGYSEDGLKTVFGGEFRGHPPIHRFEVKVTRPDHPLAVGVSDFTVTDELYRFSTENSDDFEVFVEGVSEEHSITEPIAWTHTHGRGEVVTYLLGHLGPSLQHDSSRRLVSNVVARARARLR